MSRACVFAFSLCIVAPTAYADLECRAAWLREPPPKASVLAGYTELRNRGSAPLSIIALEANGFERAEIHRTDIQNGMARMHAVENLTISPGESAVLEPGGMHIMLFRPRRALHAGDKVAWYFTTDQGPQRCTAVVEK